MQPYITYAGAVPDAGRSIIPYLDCLALPSTNEGCPMVVLEACRAGIPVIATAVGAIPEIIKDGVSGLLIPRTSEAVADALRRFADKEFRDAVGANARRDFSAEYNIVNTAIQYDRCYREALQTAGHEKAKSSGSCREWGRHWK
jgi:glycosyltransferase involved in cell wall biosynthesis